MRKLSVIAIASSAITILCFPATGCSDKKLSAMNDSIAQDTSFADTSAIEDTTEILIEETPMPKAADELFDDFIFNFAGNRKLQKKRIQFPLPVFRNGKQIKQIEKSQWKMERFFMRKEFYTLIFDSQKQMNLVKDTTIDHVAVEKVFFNIKTVQQYIFNRVRGEWMLTSINYLPIHATHNASFLKFYDKFATDSAFQIEHLNNPVKFSGPDPDDDFGTMTGEIDPETWPAFAPQLPHGMIYNIIYGQNHTESNRKIFIIRGIANGLETELIFRREHGEWKLMKLNT